MICVRVRVSGRVQGVGYRSFTRTQAAELGVKGWVQNLPGGGVEALLQGERKNVGELLAQMKTGPARALVSGMDISEVRCQEIDEFKVVY
ncbi:MAG TPA: acylphosphatase [Methanothrix sp.]|nr:acylphosphatase [Methanothrix sp.]HRW83366.1 acylphosphatase [Methanothrix sp.]